MKRERGASPRNWPKPWPVGKMHVCEICSEEFKHRANRNANRCCSKKCGWVLNAKEGAAKRALNPPRTPRVIPMHACSICGTVTHKLRCCEEHEKEWSRRKSREDNVNRSERDGKAAICKECRKPFTLVYGINRRLYCSDECHKERAQRIGHSGDRARRRGCTVIDAIDPRDVFEAADWNCQICGGRMAELKSYPDPDSPTLDHIIPIALGGQHTLDNVRAAHLLCNCQLWNKDWGPGVARVNL